MKKKERKHLCYDELVKLVHQSFCYQEKHKRFPDRSCGKISTVDCLMSALAVFNYKWPSLLQYNESRRDRAVSTNLKQLSGIAHPPSDTYMRERLDPVNPQYLRLAFNRIFAQLQRGKLLEDYVFKDGAYLLSIDGTGHYSSDKVFCQHCCETKHRDGHTTYYHQLLGAVLVHPNKREVIPLAPEPITNGDGAKKNDCERNASKRLLESIRREHPHCRFIVVEDGLASNGPHIKWLQKLKLSYILGAKAKANDHRFLFDWVDNSQATHYEVNTPDGIRHQFRFINGVPLNDTHFDLTVNFLEYWETHPNGKKQHFSWVTDSMLQEANVFQVMRGGRARWRVENETFNTLKNQGYHFKHNYGHGNDQLANVFSLLMMLAFLIDQAQRLCSPLFRQARARVGRWSALWEEMRVNFRRYSLSNWEQLFRLIASPQERSPPLV